MGVYIKGMEMPHDCDSCKVSDILDCTLWKPMDIGERHPECPLVEVPTPHGRLIDADDVKSRMIPLSFSVQKWFDEVELSNCNTVIEAEGRVDD